MSALGVERTCRVRRDTSGFDPERKSAREGCVRSRPSPVNHGCRISEIHRRDPAAAPPSALTYLKHPHVLSGFPSLLDSGLIVTRPKLARRIWKHARLSQCDCVRPYDADDLDGNGQSVASRHWHRARPLLQGRSDRCGWQWQGRANIPWKKISV